MAVTGVTKDQYEDFLKNGGNVTFSIDADDICHDTGFEEIQLIKPYLNTGFELRPSTIIHDPQEAATIYVYGDSWTRVVTIVYRNAGKIVYKKAANGKYQAECSIPK